MMMRPPVFPEESQRLNGLRELVVLDSAPEEAFDSIARLASDVCGVPIALLSLVDKERQWFKANVGLPGVNETPRDVAFCAYAIGSDDLLEIPDATQDPRFASNPLVTGSPDIRFYAGAPLILPGGERIGTLCVIDRETRRLSTEQSEMLRSLAKIASQALVMRRDLINKSLSVRSQYEQALAASEASHRALVEMQSELVSLANPDGALVYVNPAYARHFDRTPLSMVGTNLLEMVDPADQTMVRNLIAGVMRSGQQVSSENRMVASDGTERWIAWTNSVLQESDGHRLLHSVGRDVTERHRIQQALQASQEFLYRTGRTAGVGGWEVNLRDNVITWSDETRRIHEVAADYVPVLSTAIEFYAPEARPVVEEAVRNGMSRGEPWDLELPFVTAKGRSIWIRTVGEVEFDDGSPVRLVGAFQDITSRKQLELRLAENERLLRSVVEAIPAIVAVVGIDMRYRLVNSTCARWLGRKRKDIIGLPVQDILGSAEFERSKPWIDRVFSGETVSFEKDYADGRVTRHLGVTYIPLWLEGGSIDGFITVALDITQQKREEGRLVQLAHRDALTGLLNRAGFERYIEQPREAGAGGSLALLYIDLDHFKPVNDRHGHPVGDQLLQLFAQRLTAQVRPTDAVARLGGDEFAIALSGIRRIEDAQAIADKVVQAAQLPFSVHPHRLQVSASVGVAFDRTGDTSWKDLVAQADARLYKAKKDGRGRQA